MIGTERLELVDATPEILRAALAGDDKLAAALGAAVPPTWPPEFLDSPALEWVLRRLTETPDQLGWFMYFVVLRGPSGARTAIGTAGYKGPPIEGTVEVGYGIVRDQRRRGYASEATRGLIAHAFR